MCGQHANTTDVLKLVKVIWFLPLFVKQKQKHTRKTNLGIGRGPKSPEGTQAFTEELRAFWTLGDTTDTQTRSASVLLLLPDEEWPEPNYLGCHPQLHPDPHQSPALLAPGYPVDILTSHMH